MLQASKKLQASKNLWRLLVTSSLVLVVGAPASHADGAFPQKERVYVSPMLTYYDAPDEEYEDTDIGATLAIGYGFTERFLMEIIGHRISADYEEPGVQGSGQVDMYGVNALYKLETEGVFQPFLSAGLGRASFDKDQFSTDDTQLNGGVGAFLAFSDRLGMRGDLRGVHSTQPGGIDLLASLGLTAVLGPLADRGPADADRDGVPDDSDRCPGTPLGTTVDASGCEMDSDGDGVADSADQCPNTARGAQVDKNGCEGDSDGDGVKDSADACPDTPRGVAVNSRGCPPDADGDGVPDYQDKCPDTERGALVDADGCYQTLDETVRIDLNLEFDTNSSVLRPDHAPEIERVADFLTKYPQTQTVIEGHTDSSGAESYNLQLSERRAKAVHDELVSRYGVRTDRLSYRGYGEARPIADNNTAEGRQRNRRVTAVVSATETVRKR